MDKFLTALPPPLTDPQTYYLSELLKHFDLVPEEFLLDLDYDSPLVREGRLICETVNIGSGTDKPPE